jgi:hypothetical protein
VPETSGRNQEQKETRGYRKEISEKKKRTRKEIE